MQTSVTASQRPPLSGFDPSALPLLREGEALPPVPLAHLQAAALRQRFAAPPAWQVDGLNELPWDASQPLVPSAVLIPLVMRDQLQVLLTERSANLSKHSGQIAFAGGRMDASDADAIACALREAQEEIGLQAHALEILGTLPTYVTGTAFAITPVVALLQPDYRLLLNPQEVQSAFEIPLAHLMNPANHFLQEWRMADSQRRWFAMPSTDHAGQNRYVWGASAGILRNLYRLLAA